MIFFSNGPITQIILHIAFVFVSCENTCVPSEQHSCAEETSINWHYHGKLGYADWPRVFPNCGGKRQSPINLNPFTSHAVYFDPLSFNNYDQAAVQATLINNGHSLEVHLSLKERATLSGGNLGGQYAFAQYHLHWGAHDVEGSEHTVNSVRYPMELHLVHFNTLYGGPDEALNWSDGVAVLAVLFEISATDNPALAPLIMHLDAAHKNVGEQVVHDLYPLTSLLPRDMNRFYRYHGSLTTPPCNEAVTWTIFSDPIAVSEAQMSVIRGLYDADHHPLVDNFRPTQPLNERQLYRSFL